MQSRILENSSSCNIEPRIADILAPNLADAFHASKFFSDQPTRILNDKKHKSFRILQQFHFFYKLNILSKWYATDIFYVSNLTRATDSKQSPFTEQRNPSPAPAVINNKNQTE